MLARIKIININTKAVIGIVDTLTIPADRVRLPSTGLRDKIGEEIFYKDILTDGLYDFRVEWDKSNARFILIYKSGGRPKKMNMHRAKLLTKTGNQYEQKR